MNFSYTSGARIRYILFIFKIFLFHNFERATTIRSNAFMSLFLLKKIIYFSKMAFSFNATNLIF